MGIFYYGNQQILHIEVSILFPSVAPLVSHHCAQLKLNLGHTAAPQSMYLCTQWTPSNPRRDHRVPEDRVQTPAYPLITTQLSSSTSFRLSTASKWPWQGLSCDICMSSHLSTVPFQYPAWSALLISCPSLSTSHTLSCPFSCHISTPFTQVQDEAIRFRDCYKIPSVLF